MMNLALSVVGRRCGLALGVGLFFVSILNAAEDARLKNWPSWRGPLANGVAPLGSPPVSWAESNHVKWKVAPPGFGTASPIVWEDQVFVLTAIPLGKEARGDAAPESPTVASSQPPTASVAAAAAPSTRERGAGGGGGGRMQVEKPSDSHQFAVIAYDRATGTERWRDTPRTELPHEGHHKDHGFASASPVTDGEVLIAYFGSRGLFAYDLKGKRLWQKDLGRQTTRNGFGEGSSPVLHGDTVVVVWDHEGEDFIAAFDKRTGTERWRKPREESTNWTTPLVLDFGGKTEVIVNSSNKVRSYELQTGEILWEVGGQTANAIPSPVTGHGRVYVMSGFRGSALQAIALGRRGDLTATDAIAWSHNKATPYVPSPLLYGDLLYFYAGNNAQLSIFNAKEGRQLLDAERLDGIFGVYASPTGAADRVYLTGRNGAVWVIRNQGKLEVLARNVLEDSFDATPAIVGKELFLRGHKYLYALAD